MDKMDKKRHREKRPSSPLREASGSKRPSPAAAFLARHEDFKARLARRDDPLAKLLARATETRTPGKERLIRSVLTGRERRRLFELFEEARVRYPAELQERVCDLRKLLEALHPLGVLARVVASNLFTIRGEYFEPTFAGSEAKVEFVAGLLTSSCPPSSAKDPPDSDAMQKVFDLLDEIFEISILLNFAMEATSPNRSDARVRFDARSQWLAVRGPAYPQHALDLAHAVFGRYASEMRRRLGFSLGDLVDLQDSVTSLIEDRINDLRELALRQAPEIAGDLRGFVETQASPENPPVSHEGIEEWLLFQILDRFLTHALSFDLDELFEHAPTLSRKTVEAILGRLSVEVGSTPSEAFSSPLDHNPILEKPFIKWGQRFMLPIPGIVARDYVRLLEGELLSSQKKFSLWRAQVVDDLAACYLSSMLPGAVAQKNLLYPVSELGEKKWVEVDGIVLFDTVALVIEAKSSPLSSAALRGDVKRARADLKRAVGDAARQGQRVADYLSQHDPALFYDKGRNEALKVETSRLERVHLVLPTLHSLGDYGMNPMRLSQLGLAADTDVWSVYINDLRIISETVRNPAEFLHYIFWRSRIPLGTRVRVVDEIDLFSSFLLREQFRQLEDAATRYIELTGYSTDFDDFYLGEIGHAPKKDRPRMFSTPMVSRFLERLAKERPAGWLSAAGTCLELSLEELGALDELATQVLKRVDNRGFATICFGRCIFVGLGSRVEWSSVWNSLHPGHQGFKRVIFGELKRGRPSLVWALDV